MEPLQGWGPPPWSLTPKAGALRLTLCLLLLGVAHCAREMPSCPEEEFPVGAKCCPKCSPGHRVKEACGETTGTVCAPCSPGTYTAHRNGLDECLPCHLCDPDRRLVTRRKCSSTGNTVCGCDRGHFCVLVDGDDCAECRPHRDCRPGQRMQVTGTERQDTLCEDCPPGTFSAGGTQEVCEPWSKCSILLEMEAKPGTNSTDVTCTSSVKVVILCVCTVILVILMPASLINLHIRIRRLLEETTQKTHSEQWRRQQADWDTTADQALQASPILPDVTTVSVEETASVFPDRHPPAHECLQDADI
ncbi:tumor necrosis factor receptor superfamily member 14-like isoform 2-T2 [Molossus nigricans]